MVDQIYSENADLLIKSTRNNCREEGISRDQSLTPMDGGESATTGHSDFCECLGSQSSLLEVNLGSMTMKSEMYYDLTTSLVQVTILVDVCGASGPEVLVPR